MKIRLLHIIIILYLPVFALAQPTMTRDWLGTIGDEFAGVRSAVLLEPGESGANVVWDFSGMTPDTFSLQYELMPPEQTPYDDKFPMSNIASVATSGNIDIYNFFVINEEIWENFGVASNASTTVYTDPETYVEFPFGYNDKFDDSYSGSTSLVSITTFTQGNTSVTADGWGTLQLPGSSFDNVLRIKTERTSVDSSDLGLGIFEKIVERSTQYSWYSSSHHGALVTYETSERMQIAIVPPLDPDTMFFKPDTVLTYDPSAVNTSVDYLEDAFDLQISPNPVSDQAVLQFTLLQPGLVTLEVNALNGQRVQLQQSRLASGRHEITINLAQLQAGVYIVKLRNGVSGTARKIIKTN